MRWEGGRESDNVEDQRGDDSGGDDGGGGFSFGPGGGGGGGPTMVMGGGLGTIAIIVVALLMGVDPMALFGPPQGGGPMPGGPPMPRQGDPRAQRPGEQRPAAHGAPGDEQLKKFVSVVLADTEDVWKDQFSELGKRYREPKLVLFTGRVNSACGRATAAVGPFYCPGDQKVYLDLAFFQQLKNQFHAPGEFAQAYVIAHEIGHHVQKLLGISDQVDSMRGRLGKREQNALSVRLELQADFFAGVWAHYADKSLHIIEAGDIDSALQAATAIGDDRLQKQGQGYVVPDSFTHGTSEQRARWFKKGYETGDINQGDTFSAKSL